MTTHELSLSFAARSDIGARDNQEDRYFIDRKFTNDKLTKDVSFLSIVADGMGGHAKGEVASQLSVDTFTEFFYKNIDQYKVQGIPTLLNDCINYANNVVITEANKLKQLGNMGNTLCAAVVDKLHLYWVSVGDSRIYRIRNGEMQLLSRDFTLEQDIKESIEKGILTEDLLVDNDQLNALTSYIGIDKNFRHAANTEELVEGDCFLICSDGIYESVKDEVIAGICAGHDANQIVNKIFDEHLLPNMNEGQDNATAVVIKVEKYVPKLILKKEDNTQVNVDSKISKNKILIIGILTFFILLAATLNYLGLVKLI